MKTWQEIINESKKLTLKEYQKNCLTIKEFDDIEMYYNGKRVTIEDAWSDDIKSSYFFVFSNGRGYQIDASKIEVVE